jgi:radical SAM protein with 4Fe4S-binding SPASM domain
MKTVSYSDFSKRLHSVSIGKRIPINAALELTYRCNNNCVHCYCSLPANHAAAADELSTGEIRGLFDRLASMGSLWLLLTGGEPLLRPDFEEIYLHAREKGFLITLFTNGTMIDKYIAQLLSKHPPFFVEVTLYGASEKTYESVTRVKGSYERCLSGIEKLLRAGIQLKLKTMALTINRHEMVEMDRMARDLGCEFRFDPLVQKRIDGQHFSTPEHFRISAEAVGELEKLFPRRIEAYRKACGMPAVKTVTDARLYQCGAGVGSVHVNPYGIVMGCSTMLRNGFSLREHDMGWIWHEGIRSVIGQKKDFDLPCDDCRLTNLCGQCAAWSILEHGGPEKEVEYLCKIAKIKYRMLKVGDIACQK